ncbi:uncharacterized protein LOC135378569 isoform X1 [Ornithodoros turicata]|uniref:uncharacterized protein LOC135378568 isoform X1 n=1 Tax=Ornithodoros turicata TaxID=34597 RepID=UPI00313A074F
MLETGSPASQRPPSRDDICIFEEDDGLVRFPNVGIQICSQLWQDLQQQKDSHFVKSLAVAIWGTETLMERTLTGSLCNSRKQADQQPWPRLSPIKVSLIKGSLRRKLEAESEPAAKIESSLEKVNRYLAEKINDLRKSARRVAAMSTE